MTLREFLIQVQKMTPFKHPFIVDWRYEAKGRGRNKKIEKTPVIKKYLVYELKSGYKVKKAMIPLLKKRCFNRDNTEVVVVDNMLILESKTPRFFYRFYLNI